ncbi:MAG: hypothetical protein ACRD0H_12185 [Actinomycetes bacterium]
MFTQDIRHAEPDQGAPEGASQAGAPLTRWVLGAGAVITIVSVFGGVFPYFSAGAGLPLDGAADGAMTTWRTALHLVPGVVGVAIGLYLMAWGRRGAPLSGATGGRLAARLALVTGGWFAIGPYIWSLIEPGHAVGTGGMAGAMSPMDHMSWVAKVIMPVMEKVPAKMTTANCAFTMGVCHWAVGALVVLVGMAALGAGLGIGPLSGLSGQARTRVATVDAR